MGTYGQLMESLTQFWVWHPDPGSPGPEKTDKRFLAFITCGVSTASLWTSWLNFGRGIRIPFHPVQKKRIYGFLPVSPDPCRSQNRRQAFCNIVGLSRTIYCLMNSIVQTLTYLASTTKGAWLVFLSLTPYNMGVYGLHWTQLGHQYRYFDKFTVLFSTFTVLLR